MEKNYKYMVVTRCFTYNHAPYIVDAMNGFTMQETSFPVITLIVDDASTDGEPEVIRDYLTQHFHKPYRTEETDDYQLICANHKSNPNCTFVVFFLKYNHYSIKKTKFPYLSEWLDNAKYHALCEGDDYWIHPGKLQMQVDFMERNQDYSMCFHNAIVTYDDKPKAAHCFNMIGENKNINVEELVKRWIVPTASIIYRATVLPFFTVDKPIISGDWLMILHCAANGNIWGMKLVMSCYRKTYGTSSSTSRYNDKSEIIMMQKCYILNSFNKYTENRYFDITKKYIDFWKKYANFTRLKKKCPILTIIVMPIFSIKKVYWKLFNNQPAL